MKPKPGKPRLPLFLVSVFSYISLSSQASLPDTIANARQVELTASAYFSSAGFTVSKLFFWAPGYVNIQSPISDTTVKKDRDQDGVPDSQDKCPDEKGARQYDGCPVPDSDNDGIADDIDLCPTIVGTAKYKGCPPSDKDGDKINDEDDKCPNQAGVARYAGCPVGDKDRDGVDDDDDKCMDVAGTAANLGCPGNSKGTSETSKEKNKKRS